MKDIFLIDIDEKQTIIYAPLKGVLFKTNDIGKYLIEKYLNGLTFTTEEKSTVIWNHIEKLNLIEDRVIKDETSISGAVILLSQNCNLACTYCYSADSRASDTISFDKLKTGIDYIFENTTTNNLKFTFIGGGEPLVTWELLKQSIDYIKLCNESEKYQISYNIATNGTLIDDEKARYFKDNKINLSLSFEILPAIQDKQRPFYKKDISSFEEVDKAIKILATYVIYPRLRSTITMDNVDKMEEMVKFVIERYSELGHLHFEHVAENTDSSNKEFYDKFLNYYFIAKKVADSNGIELKNSIVNSINRVSNNFCNGEFVITPMGDISKCHRFSSSKDQNYEKFVIGEIRGQEIKIFDKSNIEEKSVECMDCFAKYSCGGGCPAVLNGMSEEKKKEYCVFTKNLIIKALLDKINMSEKKEG